MTVPFRKVYHLEMAVKIILEVEQDWKQKLIKNLTQSGLQQFGIFNQAVSSHQEEHSAQVYSKKK